MATQIYLDLKGKTVVVTGANRGIGKAVCQAFMRNGSQVVCVYRKTRPDFSAGACGGPAPLFLQADVRDVETISRWAQEYTEAGNRLDILINNAGVYIPKPLLDCDDRDWCETIHTNLKSMLFISQTFARQMKADKGGGVIINAASFTATMGSAGYALYSISKVAIVEMTRCMAAEWAPYHIRVNAFSPGIARTRMTEPMLKENEAAVLAPIAMNRVGTVEEVSNVVLFLASQVSSYITGQNLNINGGKFIVQNPHAPWERQEA